jgi:uncharacterized protein (DUF2147 family)
MPVRFRTATVATCAAALVAATAAAAQDGPTGAWMVKDRTAIVRIVDCGGQYWGVVAWEKTPGLDKNNPNPALRSRPTLGMPVLLDMRPDGRGRWSGRIYNAEDGQTYDSHVELTGADTLRVEGCALGFLCGGETWSRTANAPAVAQARRPTGHATTGAGRATRSIANESAARVCSALGRR